MLNWMRETACGRTATADAVAQHPCPVAVTAIMKGVASRYALYRSSASIIGTLSSQASPYTVHARLVPCRTRTNMARAPHRRTASIADLGVLTNARLRAPSSSLSDSDSALSYHEQGTPDHERNTPYHLTAHARTDAAATCPSCCACCGTKAAPAAGGAPSSPPVRRSAICQHRRNDQASTLCLCSSLTVPALLLLWPLLSPAGPGRSGSNPSSSSSCADGRSCGPHSGSKADPSTSALRTANGGLQSPRMAVTRGRRAAAKASNACA